MKLYIKILLYIAWYGNLDEETGKPVGTLRIPSFLEHASGFIDSRSILRNTTDYVGEEILKLVKKSLKQQEESLPSEEWGKMDLDKFRIQLGKSNTM